MSHHSSSVNGEGNSHKDPLSRILDELSSLNLWKEKIEKKEKGKERVQINQDEREQQCDIVEGSSRRGMATGDNSGALECDLKMVRIFVLKYS